MTEKRHRRQLPDPIDADDGRTDEQYREDLDEYARQRQEDGEEEIQEHINRMGCLFVLLVITLIGTAVVFVYQLFIK